MAPEDALKDNEKYKVVWEVLQALRAHDDRFNTTVNQIELNKARPNNIQVIGVGGGQSDGGNETAGKQAMRAVQVAFNFPQLDDWRNAIYAKIVQKCGDRRYWEGWATDVARIAERHTARIKVLLASGNPDLRASFDRFVDGLRENLNPSISQDDAIEMLSQHLITKPVFDSLFEGYEFTKQNPVSVAMQRILDDLEDQSLEKETESLSSFYASVHQRARGIDNAEGKQRIILELYDKFFRAAFPKVAERLGIVYTPVEIVDFILHSVDHALKTEFGANIGDPGVHVLDPFTGTGTFIVRLLQSGLIQKSELLRKYQQELHANEIVLLAYYIAAINIEESFHGISGGEYQPFNGIILTDTFQLTENAGTFGDVMFPENNKRAAAQNQFDIRVVVGNPPYSVGQDNANDANQNLKYPNLDKRIENTYAKFSTATNKNSLYDSYIRAIRWASDRVKDKGIVCYVTNGSFIDGNAADGLRKCLTDEFSAIYCFNLRGNQRTSGELSRREGGKVFGSGSRTPVAITLLVKNPEKAGQLCKLFYQDIGDYLSREDKLNIVAKFQSAQAIPWEPLTPNSSHDWINQRNPEFATFTPLGDKTEAKDNVLFDLYSRGIATSRDAWTYNFSKHRVANNMERMVEFYNHEAERYTAESVGKSQPPKLETIINNDPSKISWSRGLKQDAERGKSHSFDERCIVSSVYRPFTRQWVYFSRQFNDMVYLMPQLFPTPAHPNLAISVTGVGASKTFSALITDAIPNLHLHDTGQCFPLYLYEKPKAKPKGQSALFDGNTDSEYRRKDAITDAALKSFRTHYGDPAISKEDIFCYVYGVLHSPEYKRRFASDLKKMLPRIPMTPDFHAFSSAGRELAKWHLDYESVEPYPLQEASDRFDFDQKDQYRICKMTFGKKDGKPDKSVIVYNSHIALTAIPLEAYEYVVNGKPALEWIMERYQLTRDPDSQIANDPNDYSDDPAYILNLVKRIVRVSLETVRIVNNLPALNTVA
jgi:predicted helicase